MNERRRFAEGIDYVVNRLHPKAIVVYSTAPDSIFAKYRDSGIIIRQINSEFDLCRKAVNV